MPKHFSVTRGLNRPFDGGLLVWLQGGTSPAGRGRNRVVPRCRADDRSGLAAASCAGWRCERDRSVRRTVRIAARLRRPCPFIDRSTSLRAGRRRLHAAARRDRKTFSRGRPRARGAAGALRRDSRRYGKTRPLPHGEFVHHCGRLPHRLHCDLDDSAARADVAPFRRPWPFARRLVARARQPAAAHRLVRRLGLASNSLDALPVAGRKVRSQARSGPP